MAESINTSSEQFALRWNNYFHNLSSGFSSYLHNKDLVDVTLAVEGKLLEAHKLVLSICSTFFENIFKNNPCQHPVVVLQDMKYSEVDALVRFMYQGEVNVKQEDLTRFLKVAEVLKIKGLTLDNSLLNFSNASTDLSTNSTDQKIKGPLNNNSIRKRNLNVRHDVKTKHDEVDSVLSKPLKQIKASSITPNDIPEKNSSSTVSPYVKLNYNTPCSIDLTEDDIEELDKNIELASTNSNTLTKQSSDIELLTYRLSAQGQPQLIHEGYSYNLTSRSTILDRSLYRCTEQHRGCRGKCAVVAEEFMPIGIHNHNHPPYDKPQNDNKKKKL